MKLILITLLIAVVSCTKANKVTEMASDMVSDTAESVAAVTDTVKEKVTETDLNWDLKPGALNIELTKEKFMTMYATKKDEVGAKCSAVAMSLCGKQTKDNQVTASELLCLVKKTFRVTRQRIPELDESDCASYLKSQIQ